MTATDASEVIIGRVAKPVHRQLVDRSREIGLSALKYLVLGVAQAAIKVVDLSVPRRFSLVETTPFIDPRQFEWHKILMAAYPKIRSELEALLSHAETIPNHQDIVEAIRTLTDDDKWLSHFLYIYGRRFEKQCAECPQTTALLDEIPGMKTAFFSILSPGKRIPPHKGPYRGVMRYHLPLLVPSHGDCAIRVHDEIAKFEEGVAIMFDDTYEHEVWNDTEETRVVLFLDIVRPMKFPFNLVNSAIIGFAGWSPLVKGMQKNQLTFDRAVKKSA